MIKNPEERWLAHKEANTPTFVHYHNPWRHKRVLDEDDVWGSSGRTLDFLHMELLTRIDRVRQSLDRAIYRFKRTQKINIEWFKSAQAALSSFRRMLMFVGFRRKALNEPVDEQYVRPHDDLMMYDPSILGGLDGHANWLKVFHEGAKKFLAPEEYARILSYAGLNELDSMGRIIHRDLDPAESAEPAESVDREEYDVYTFGEEGE